MTLVIADISLRASGFDVPSQLGQASHVAFYSGFPTSVLVFRFVALKSFDSDQEDEKSPTPKPFRRHNHG